MKLRNPEAIKVFDGLKMSIQRAEFDESEFASGKLVKTLEPRPTITTNTIAHNGHPTQRKLYTRQKTHWN